MPSSSLCFRCFLICRMDGIFDGRNKKTQENKYPRIMTGSAAAAAAQANNSIGHQLAGLVQSQTCPSTQQQQQQQQTSQQQQRSAAATTAINGLGTSAAAAAAAAGLEALANAYTAGIQQFTTGAPHTETGHFKQTKLIISLHCTITRAFQPSSS